MDDKSPGTAVKCYTLICNPRRLLTFGVPLFIPSVILTAIAFVSFPDFGVIHIVGILLLLISVICIFFGSMIMLCARKQIKPPVTEEVTIQTQTRQSCDNNLSMQDKVVPKIPSNTKNKQKVTRPKVRSKDASHSPRKKRKTSRGKKDVKNTTNKLPTLTEDKEGEIFRITSAGAMSVKSLSSLKLPLQTISVNESRSKKPPVINVWREDTVTSARSDFSVVSDSSIYFTQDVELTPIEVLEQNSCFLSLPSNPPLRSLSLSNILESSSSASSETEQ